MKTANVIIGKAAVGLAVALGAATLAATPGFAQELYVRSVEPAAPGVVVVEQPAYAAPRQRVIVREQPAPVIVQEAPGELPERVIVTEPGGGPFAREVYVRREAPLPPAPVLDEGYGCRTVERQAPSGIVTVSTLCD